MEKYLIKNTTKEQREQIIRDSLGCGSSSCENCSACGAYGAINPFDMYQPYIDGVKELSEINQGFNPPYFLK